MKKEEVLQIREVIANELILAMKKNLGENPNIYHARPNIPNVFPFLTTADGVVYEARNANYIRALEWLMRHPDVKDGRFIRKEYLVENNIKVSLTTDPLYIETWDAEAQEVRIVDCYNVEDLPKVPELIVSEGLSNSLDFYADMLYADTDYSFETEHMFQSLVPRISSNDGSSYVLNELSQSMFAFNMLTYCNTKVSPSVWNINLEDLEKNPMMLYEAAQIAEKAKRIELPAEINKEQSKRNELEAKRAAAEHFKDLKVIFDWAEYSEDLRPKDLKGNPYPMDEHLTLVGPEAYEFLVTMNHLDKRCYSIKEFFKSSFTVEYKDYRHQINFDIGLLQFNNSTNITDALRYRLDLERQSALHSEKLANSLYGLKVSASKLHPEMELPTLSEFMTEEEKQSKNFNLLMDEFKKEEDAFLSVHPEFKEYNEYTVPMYYYRIAKDKLDDFPYSFAKRTIEPKEFGDFVFAESPKKNLLYPSVYHSIENCSPASMQEILDSRYTIVESSYAPWQRYDDDLSLNACFVVSKENFAAITEPLKSLELSITNSKGEEKNYSGITAVYTLDELLTDDVDRYNDAIKCGYHFPGEKNAVCLEYDGMTLFAGKCEAGERKILKRIPDGLRGFFDEIKNQAAVEAMDMLSFYQQSSNIAIHGKNRRCYSAAKALASEKPLPDLKESFENYASHDIVHHSHLYEYEDGHHYRNLAEFVPGSSKDKATAIMEQAAKDGFTYREFKKLWCVMSKELNDSMKEVYNSNKEIKNMFKENNKPKEKTH